MQRIKHMKVISAAAIAILLFSSVTATAAGSREFSADSESAPMEEVYETGSADLDSLSKPPATDAEQAAGSDAPEETAEDATEETTTQATEDFTESTEPAKDSAEEADTVDSQESSPASTDHLMEAEEVEEIGEPKNTEELTIPAGVWSDQEPFFTNDGSEESTGQPFQMARAAGACPTYQEAYAAMMNLQDQYPEGMTWTNFEPYGSAGSLGEYYRFQGGYIKGANLGVGCAAFAFILSDEAFGSLPSRTIDRGGFSYEDIKVGDILRINNNSHFVIVLQISTGGVTVAEANYNKSVHWGRAISVADIMTADFLVTRYPDGYTENDHADDTAQEGTEGTLGWTLTNAGVLTISGTGDMPEYTETSRPTWDSYIDKINTIIIENGITSIGSYAFYGSPALTVYLPDGITRIGTSAFQNSKLVAVTIPKTTLNVEDRAFHSCENLTSASIPEGVETIGDGAFQACTALRYLDFPASITSVGSNAFTSCKEVIQIRFAPGTGAVEIGDSAFAQCQKLVSVTLPQGLKAVSNYMFQSCTLLAEVYIPANISEIGENPFTSTYIQYGGTISFGGSEATWINIGGRFILNSMPNANIKYDVPFDDPFASDPNDPGDFKPADPDESGDSGNKPGDGSGNNPGDGSGNKPGDGSGNKPGDDSGNKPGDDSGSDPSDRPGNIASSDSNRITSESTASIIESSIKAFVEVWKPATPDEAKRYACMGKEAIQFAQPSDGTYQVDIKNAMQGPMCFQSFEAVLGDYTIGRTYNIYPLTDATYHMDEEIQLSIKIPSAIYKKDREYKMICVIKGGQPIIYNDLDSNPETITIKTNNFYAYALIYK